MATKKKPAKPGKPTDPIAPALAVGERLLAALIDELKVLKNPGNKKQNMWGLLSEIQQDEVIDRVSRKIQHQFRLAFESILAAGVPAVQAELASVTFGSKGIRGSLEIEKGSPHRHELADFSGHQVLVILTQELEEYLESMKSVKPDKDQGSLPLEDQTLAEAFETDTRTLKELTTDAVALAEKLNEDDIDWSAKGRPELLDYIGWAEKQLASKETDKTLN